MTRGRGKQPDGPFRRVVWVWVEARRLAPLGDLDGPVDKYLDDDVDYVHSVLLSEPTLDGAPCSRIEPERVMYAEAYEGRFVYLAGAMLFRIYYFGNPI